MGEPYSFRDLDCSPQVLNASASLMKTAWGENDFSSPEFIRWQYQDNPYGAVIGCYASPETSATGTDIPSLFAAQYVVIPSPLAVPGTDEPIRAALSVNTVTHPEHQGKKLFVRLAERCFERAASDGVRCVFGFPNQSSLPGFKKLGFSVSPELKLSFALLRPVGLPLHALRVLSDWRNPNPRPCDDSEVGEALPPGLALPSPPNSLLNCIHVPRERAWVSWRYAQHPTRRYLHFSASASTLIFRTMKLGTLRVCLLFDILGTLSSAEVKQFKRALTKARIDVVCGVFAPSAPRYQPLLRTLLPFSVPTRFSPKPFFVITRALKGDLPEAPDYYTLGDLDLY